MADDARIGTTLLGKYLIERVLGEGGMGIVYAARHLRLDRPVAIKFLHASYAKNKGALDRFFIEARAAGSLRHPNVVDVSDLETDGDAPFMVLELLTGESLSSLLARQGRLSVEEALDIVVPVLDALEAAHAKGIVHRDLKPDNIFLALEAGRTVPKLLDFGIAKLRDGSAIATSTGVAMGTPMYMSPEQARGAVREIGPRSDVWAIGVVLFECLTGRYPFDFDPEAGPLSFIALVVTARPRKLRDALPGAPDAIASAVDRALEQDPARRLGSAATMRATLRGEPLPEPASPVAKTLEVGGALPTDPPPRADRSVVPRTREVPRSRAGSRTLGVALALAAAGALVLTALGAVGWAATHRASPIDPPPRVAEPPTPPPSPAPAPPVAPATPTEAPAPSAPPETPGSRAVHAVRRSGPVVETTAPPAASGAAPDDERTETRTGAWDPDEL